MKALVVIPTYNEVNNIQRIVPLVLEQGDGIEVLVAGGGSELAAARSRLGQLGWEFR